MPNRFLYQQDPYLKDVDVRTLFLKERTLARFLTDVCREEWLVEVYIFSCMLKLSHCCRCKSQKEKKWFREFHVNKNEVFQICILYK